MATAAEKEGSRANKKSSGSNDFRRLDKSRINENGAQSSKAQAGQKSRKERKATEDDRVRKKIKETQRTAKKELDCEEDALAEHRVIESCMRQLDDIDEETKDKIRVHSATLQHALRSKRR